MHLRVLALILAMSMLVLSHAKADELVKITNGEWLPFFSQSLDGYGRASQIVTEAFNYEGIKVEYGFFPWKRSYRLSELGVWDGTIGWHYSEERAETHYYSKHPVSSGEWVLFHRKELDIKTNSINGLMNYTFGLTLGDWALDGVDHLTTAMREGTVKVQRAPTDEQLFLMLSLGRIDIFPQQIDVGYHQIQQLVKTGQLKKKDAASIMHYEKAYREMPLYLLLSKKLERNKHLIEIFDHGMDQLEKKGNLD